MKKPQSTPTPIKIKGKNGLKTALSIRETVFVNEQLVPKELEFDNEDQYCDHYLLLFEGKPVGTARINPNKQQLKLERFAIVAQYRRQGLGSLLFKFIIEQIKKSEHSHKTIYIHAQLAAGAFWRSFGFKPLGAEFTEAGIPHLKMVYKGDHL